jgi:hypothetical protein
VGKGENENSKGRSRSLSVILFSKFSVSSVVRSFGKNPVDLANPVKDVRL